MTLDSKDSDIEQLRSQLQALHIGLDSSSIGSGPGDAEADDGFPGMDLLSALLFVLNINQLIVLSLATDCSEGKMFVFSLRENLLLGVRIQVTFQAYFIY